MPGLSDYLTNNIIDQVLRGQAPLRPSVVYLGLATCNAGVWEASTVYAASATMVVVAEDGLYHLYETAAGGTSAATQPTFPGVPNETVSDGSVTWVEQNAGMKAGTAVAEPSGSAYARVPVGVGLTDWCGTQAAGSTTPSTGTSGVSSNNNTLTFAVPTGNWAGANGVAWGVVLYDASTGGDLLFWGPMATPADVLSGAPAIQMLAGALALSLQ